MTYRAEGYQESDDDDYHHFLLYGGCEDEEICYVWLDGKEWATIVYCDGPGTVFKVHLGAHDRNDPGVAIRAEEQLCREMITRSKQNA